VPNTSAAGVRSGTNTRLVALATHQSGTAAPSTTYPYQFWADTTNGLLKQRDGANAAFVTVGTLGVANLGLATLASPTFTGTPAAPTATAGTNTTQLANTAFVTSYAMPVLGTSQNSTSGTSIDFTSIPSWVKRITVMFNGVSTNGSSSVQVQIGSGSVTTSGYVSAANFGVNVGQFLAATSGFAFDPSGLAASAYVRSGVLVLTLIGSNTWIALGGLGSTSSQVTVNVSGNSPALSGTLDRIRVTTVNGSDTFDAGSINILYE